MGKLKQLLQRLLPPSRAQMSILIDQTNANFNDMKHRMLDEIRNNSSNMKHIMSNQHNVHSYLLEAPESVIEDDIIAVKKPIEISCLSEAQEYKIQNLLFPDCDWKYIHNRMFYCGDKLSTIGTGKWKVNGRIDFFAYFNAFSVKKWIKYTGIKNYQLHLKAKGRFCLQFYGQYLTAPNEGDLDKAIDVIYNTRLDSKSKRNLIVQKIDSSEKHIEKFNTYFFDTKDFANTDDIAEIVIPVQYEESDVVGFFLQSIGDEGCEIFGGYYSAAIIPDNLNVVDISICTTTFKKEEYITANLELIKKDILNAGTDIHGCDELASHLFVNVVDNGQTLDVRKLSAGNIKVHPNKNTGGAGGFSRGMIETAELKKAGTFNASHIIFMDDDIELLPESLKRTYALLSLVKPEYSDYFISGAMLYLEQRNEQHEDIGYITGEYRFEPVKPRLYLHEQHNILKNEQNYTSDNKYAGWWYCVTPIKYAGADNLSIPLFYRGDDIEFSHRHHAKMITLNGICVWHLGFSAKVNGVLEYYLVKRNTFIIQAIGSAPQKIDFIENLSFHYSEAIRAFAYENCDLMLDALEDFMKGPTFFAESDSYELLASHAVKKETFYPFGGIDYERVYDYIPLGSDEMKIFTDTDNGHTLPDELLKDEVNPPTIAHIFFESPGKQFMQKRIVAVNPYDKTASLREMDKERYSKLNGRKEQLIQQYKTEKSRLYSEYREYFKEFKTEKFWGKYLGV